MVFADEDSPAFMAGGVRGHGSLWIDEPKVAEAFRTGKGVGWHEHGACLFRGTERFFRPGYNANLVSSWIPALEGVAAKLSGGAQVADVGCGHGASTIVMAQAFPKSHIHRLRLPRRLDRAARARRRRRRASATRDVRGGDGQGLSGHGYDLVAFFDCLHDMGDPVGASAHVRETLAPDGTWMIVEPFAHDRLEDNLNPVGRMYYAASTMICTPASLAQEVGLGLGAQAGEAATRGRDRRRLHALPAGRRRRRSTSCWKRGLETAADATSRVRRLADGNALTGIALPSHRKS